MKKTKKEVRDFSGLFCAFILAMLTSIPLLTTGEGLIHGFSDVEKITFVAGTLISGSVGYSVGYFSPVYKWFLPEYLK